MIEMEEDKKNTVKEYFSLGEVGRYILRIFGKKDPNAPKSINLKLMHGINRITIVIFVLAILFFIMKKVLY